MKVIKKEIKEAVTAIKRLSTPKTKQEARLTIQHAHDVEGEENKLYVKAGNQEVNIFFEIKNVDNAEISITVNPYDLETLLKGKEKELEFELQTETNKLVLKGQTTGIPYEPFSGEAKNKLKGLVPLNSSELFIAILKETENVFCESHIQSSMYLELTPISARALEPKRIQYYRYQETFGFEKGFLHQNAVKFLAKTLKGEISQKVFGEFLVFQNGNGYFAVRLYQNLVSPDFKQLARKEEAYSFRVNGKTMNEQLKAFTAKVKEIEVSLENQQLVLNPRDDNFEILYIEVADVKGTFEKAVFDSATFKGLFAGYDTEKVVRHQGFGHKRKASDRPQRGTTLTESEIQRLIEAQEQTVEDGYMWWIHEPEKTVMIAGIHEPDYEKPWREAFQKA